ncbi:MAG: DUF1893 domain-containing protein [Candidatus Bathyarchaeota archaeon]|nr:DUF1893 domain-containing protein [Candidatus Bathyarchaeota archaeon]
MNELGDLELAKRIMNDRSLSLVIVKGGYTVFESGSPGISGLLEAIENLKENLYEASVADRIVGRAAALLLAHLHAKEVYAVTLSNEGLKALEANNIPIMRDNLVPKILDREGKNVCPFEKFSSAIESPDEAFELLKDFAESLKRRK